MLNSSFIHGTLLTYTEDYLSLCFVVNELEKKALLNTFFMKITDSGTENIL